MDGRGDKEGNGRGWTGGQGQAETGTIEGEDRHMRIGGRGHVVDRDGQTRTAGYKYGQG